MAWFKKTRKPIAADPAKPSRVPEGLWVKCTGCAQILYNKDLAQNLSVCPKCGHHFRMGALERLRMLFDGPWTEHDRGLVSTDPLHFSDTKPYAKRLKASIEATGLNDAVIVARGRGGGRHEALRQTPEGQHRGHGLERRGDCRQRQDRRLRDDRRRDGVRLHRRQHGRGGGRENHPRHRTRAVVAPARDYRVLPGGRTHGGGRAVIDAEGTCW